MPVQSDWIMVRGSLWVGMAFAMDLAAVPSISIVRVLDVKMMEPVSSVDPTAAVGMPPVATKV